MKPKYDSFVFFVHTDSVFSQWHPSVFTLGGETYTTCEQYMMAGKAALFGDTATRAKIMDVHSPMEQKILGREVTPFDAEMWDANARALVFEGNYGKFTQNPQLWRQMAATRGRQLVEAAHYDPLWGIGLRTSDKRAKNPAKWRGRNWLGGVLTDLRDLLLEHNFDPEQPFAERPFSNPFLAENRCEP